MKERKRKVKLIVEIHQIVKNCRALCPIITMLSETSNAARGFTWSGCFSCTRPSHCCNRWHQCKKADFPGRCSAPWGRLCPGEQHRAHLVWKQKQKIKLLAKTKRKLRIESNFNLPAHHLPEFFWLRMAKKTCDFSTETCSTVIENCCPSIEFPSGLQ